MELNILNKIHGINFPAPDEHFDNIRLTKTFRRGCRCSLSKDEINAEREFAATENHKD